jgi:hypothetical protein
LSRRASPRLQLLIELIPPRVQLVQGLAADLVAQRSGCVAEGGTVPLQVRLHGVCQLTALPLTPRGRGQDLSHLAQVPLGINERLMLTPLFAIAVDDHDGSAAVEP